VSYTVEIAIEITLIVNLPLKKLSTFTVFEVNVPVFPCIYDYNLYIVHI